MHALAFALLLTPLHTGLYSPLHWSGKMAPGTTLRVLNVRGDIHVTPASGAEATIDGEADAVLDVHVDGHTVTICVYRKGIDHCDANGIHGDHVDLAANGDDMDIDNGGGDPSGGADITVHLPPGVRIQVASGNGHIVVTDAGSDVSAWSGNGDVRVTDAAGRVIARSGSGRVDVTTTGGPVNASTGTGAIDVTMGRVPQPSDMHFSTGNGTITVTLPATYTGELEASTARGAVTSDFPLQAIGHATPQHVHATIGGGGVAGRLRLETGDGDLVVRKS
ncbi:MAG TPA: hypothetical protein VNW46_16305 [Gemmatimonadaceae bacterium]|nr:hypothetical protein [Gemmatimonadaceae bacterium]